MQIFILVYFSCPCAPTDEEKAENGRGRSQEDQEPEARNSKEGCIREAQGNCWGSNEGCDG